MCYNYYQHYVKNGLTYFYEIFRICWPRYTKTIGWTVLHLTRLFHSLHTRHSFTSISNIMGKKKKKKNIMEKWMNGFAWNFKDWSHITRGSIWNISGMLLLTPWIQECFSIFLSVFVSNIMEGDWIFMNFLGYIRHDTRRNRLDFFMPGQTVLRSSH